MKSRAKNQRRYNYKQLPPSQGYRGGCKVAWHYYDHKIQAEHASKIAIHNAEIDASLGYDFGYCSPGSVRLVTDFPEEFKGKYEVCVN